MTSAGGGGGGGGQGACGKDVTGYPWNPPWPMCVAYVDLYEQGRGRA
ncbi:MAG: hypothetical protein ACRDSN_20065 [Pseudonocardiaceae bacterium]